VAVAREWNASFVEMSVKHNINVAAAFEECARLARYFLWCYSLIPLIEQ